MTSEASPDLMARAAVPTASRLEPHNRLIVAAASPSQLPAPRVLKAGLPAQRDALARLGIHEAWVRQLDFGDRRSVAP